jgi:hypothetical protein
MIRTFRISLLLLAPLCACQHPSVYASQEQTAREFALALQAGDTVTMRRLSLPVAGAKMAAAFGEIPRAYTDFGPAPAVVRRGNPQSSDFFVSSRKLAACNGGVLIAVSQGQQPRVAAFALNPDASSAADDPCHALVSE